MSSLREWDMLVGTGMLPDAYLKRIRADAGFSAWGDVTQELGKADSFFRGRGLDSYLEHARAGKEDTEFFKGFASDLDQAGLVRGASVVEVAKTQSPPQTSRPDFWEQFSGKLGAVRAAFGCDGRNIRQENAARFASSVVGAGQLVSRKDDVVSTEAVLPVRWLGYGPEGDEKSVGSGAGDMAARRCASAYAGATAKVSWFLEQEASIYQRVNKSKTATALAPVIVAARGPTGIGEIALGAGVSYNSAANFLKLLKAKGVVTGGEQERGATYEYQGGLENRLRDRGGLSARETIGLLKELHGDAAKKSEPLPVERSTESQTRSR
jgi:hypothetical protein